MPHPKEHLGYEDYYRHTGNSKLGRRGIHKRLRKRAEQEIRETDLDNDKPTGYNSETNNQPEKK